MCGTDKRSPKTRKPDLHHLRTRPRRAQLVSGRCIDNVRIMPTALTPAALVVTLLCVLALVTGCSSLGPDPARADSAALHFHQELSDGHAAAACELLAPRTLNEVEQSAHAPCPQSLANARLPDAATVATTDVYGTNARVVLGGDTVFLARFGAQWKVTAAGCKPRTGLPYDCAVKG